MTDQSSEHEQTTADQRRRFAFFGIEQRTLQRLRSLGVRHGSQLVVGFSGGSDSLALAAILGRISGPTGIEPLLVHVDHRLRPTSAAEAEHAIQLAADLQLPIEVVTLETDLLTNFSAVGMEEAARRGRYRALATCARRLSTDIVVTAHHEDDQAETVLLHLLRGSGLDGAAAMREVTHIDVPWWAGASEQPMSIRVWRPLLQEPKTEIERYLATLGLKPNQDDSNVDERFQRNAIRHTVLPSIERVYPAARRSLGRFAEIAGAEDELLNQLAQAALVNAVTPDQTLVRHRLRPEPIAIVRRVLLHWLRDRTGISEIPFERVLAVAELVDSGREGTRIEVAGGRVATILGEDLVTGTDAEIGDLAWRRFPGPRVGAGAPDAVSLPVAGATDFGAIRFHAGARHPATGEAGRDWVRLPRPSSGAWIVRLVRPGDRFAGGRDVREWLREHRVPVWIRHDIVCLVDGDEVDWVPGLPLPPRSRPDSGIAEQYVSWSRAQVLEERVGHRKDEGVSRVLIPADAVQQKVAEMAAELDEIYRDETPLLVGVLTGAVTFMADLMRAMTVPVIVDFMAVSSYGASTQSSGVVRILKDLNANIEGRHVLVVEDIVDSGLTLNYLLDVLRRRNPADIRVVALLKKEKPEAIDVQVDRVGFHIPDEFVIGYGLDYAGRYRNLPYIGVLDPSVIGAK